MFYIAKSTPVSDAPAEFAEAWVDVPIRVFRQFTVSEANANAYEGMVSSDSLPMHGIIASTNREFAVYALRSFGRHEAAEWWNEVFEKKLEELRSQLAGFALLSGMSWQLGNLQVDFQVRPTDELLAPHTLLSRFQGVTGLVSTGQDYVVSCGFTGYER